jgi:tetratricopeptide (TPR) repeat protein
MKLQITLQTTLSGQAERTADNAGYTRREVLRILHLKGSQLSAWERTGLIPSKKLYHFGDLSLLRALRETRIPARKLRASIAAMQHRFGVRDPLLEATAVRRGSRVSFRHNGSLIDPISLQLAFDFDLSETELHGTVGNRLVKSHVNPLAKIFEVQELFQTAVQLEEDPEKTEEAAELYRQILAIRPEHAPASINLGTIHYNRRDFARAETLYRQATLADPEYALAFFDLGNVLDETLQLREAIAAYQRAVELVPQYADAHYNLALAYERQGERRRALRHWLMYARLDPIGPWASHAKGQARKILNSERLSIVSRRGRTVPIAG